MFSGENIFLFGHGYVGIDLSNINGAVSKHFLYVADVDISFQQAGGKGMTEHVWRNMEVYGSKRGILVYHSAHRLVGKGFTGLIGEKAGAGLDLRINSASVFLQDGENLPASDLDAALLVPLTVYEDNSLMQIYITVLQCAKLADSHAGCK